MKHLSQQMLSDALRKPYLDRMRSTLRERLRRPGISTEERAYLQTELAKVGAPKVYSAEEPSPPGAIDPGPMPVVPIQIDLANATHDSLSALPHTRLYLYAVQQGLEVHASDTKALIILKLLKHSGSTENGPATVHGSESEQGETS